MRDRWFAPTLLAAGIIVSTLVATVAAESRWLVLAGPLILATALVVGSMVNHRANETASKVRIGSAVILGASIILACILLVQRDPGLVAEFLPSYGGVVAILIGINPRRSRCTVSTPPGRTP